VQTFTLEGAASRVPLLGAVGPLQFEVLTHRLRSEYGAGSRLEACAWTIVRWPDEKSAAVLDESMLPGGARLARDADGRLAALFVKEWDCKYFLERHPEIALSKLPPEAGAAVSTIF